MQKPIAWFDIPVANLERARHFYEQTFGISMQVMKLDGAAMAIFPYTDPHTGGCLTLFADFKPAKGGVVIYLSGGDDLAKPLEQARLLGGKVVQPKTKIGDYGYSALFEDSEGNTIGLHSEA